MLASNSSSLPSLLFLFPPVFTTCPPELMTLIVWCFDFVVLECHLSKSSVYRHFLSKLIPSSLVHSIVEMIWWCLLPIIVHFCVSYSSSRHWIFNFLSVLFSLLFVRLCTYASSSRFRLPLAASTTKNNYDHFTADTHRTTKVSSSHPFILSPSLSLSLSLLFDAFITCVSLCMYLCVRVCIEKKTNECCFVRQDN